MAAASGEQHIGCSVSSCSSTACLSRKSREGQSLINPRLVVPVATTFIHSFHPLWLVVCDVLLFSCLVRPSTHPRLVHGQATSTHPPTAAYNNKYIHRTKERQEDPRRKTQDQKFKPRCPLHKNQGRPGGRAPGRTAVKIFIPNAALTSHWQVLPSFVGVTARFEERKPRLAQRPPADAVRKVACSMTTRRT